jgi:tRNA(His) 5'-end guanylyltransferase
MSVYELLQLAEYPTCVYDKHANKKALLPFTRDEYQVLPSSSTLNKLNTWGPLGSKLSSNEKQLVNVSGDQYYTIRLDGKNFSTVCPHLRRLGVLEEGYSQVFEDMMKDVCSFLVETLSNVTYAYTQSDEITLLFSPMPFNDKLQMYEPHVYNGRRDKLLTLCASLATQRFNRCLIMKGGLDVMESLPNVIFDARMGVYSCLSDAFELVLWRSYDCSINAVSTTLHLEPITSTPKKEVDSMNTLQKLTLLHQSGRMTSMTHHQRYGTLLYRRRKPCEVTNRLTGVTEVKNKFCVEQVEGLIVNNVKEGKLVIVES